MNKKPLFTIITVCLNSENTIQKTIESVLNQSCTDFEYIIVDGLSIDKTLEIIKNYQKTFRQKGIDYKWISEKDSGIYDAMNKGISLARGEWLNFMNSGDWFYDNEVIIKTKHIIENNINIELIYSDVIYTNNKKYLCNHKKINIIHQCLIYKRKLHNIYGLYYQGPSITISDYLFFCALKYNKWLKCNFVIAKCDNTGVSSKPNHYYQRLSVDLMYENDNKLKIICILIVYPLYYYIKKIIGKINK